MSRVAIRTLMVTITVAACFVAAVPKGWADTTILLDTNPATSRPSFKLNEVAQNTRGWVRYDAFIGAVPTTGGQPGAWTNATARSSLSLNYTVTLLLSCSNGTTQTGPTTRTNTLSSIEAALTCPGSTVLGSVHSVNPI